MVSDLTGYPPEMLDLDMDLEADLGIDSIKRVEILSQFEEKLPGCPAVSPDMMGALKTLGQITRHFNNAGAASPQQAATETSPPTATAAGHHAEAASRPTAGAVVEPSTDNASRSASDATSPTPPPQTVPYSRPPVPSETAPTPNGGVTREGEGSQPRVDSAAASGDSQGTTDSGDSSDSGGADQQAPQALPEATPLSAPPAVSAVTGDAILQGLQSGDAVAPPADTGRLEVFREVADRILVSDAAFSGEQEIRVSIKESILPGTEVRVAQEDGRLVVRLVTESDQSFRTLTQQQDALQNYLRDRLDNRPISVELSMENDTQGRSRNRQELFTASEEDDE